MAQSIFISMRQFLRTGRFGEIQPGDSTEKVRNYLGEPSTVGGSQRKAQKPSIWKYGDVEFHLTENREHLWMIFCDSFGELQVGNTATLDRWFFHGHPACELVERELSAAEIAFHRVDMAHEPTAYLLRLDSGVELMFSTGTDPATWPGCPGLFGFKLVDKRE